MAVLLFLTEQIFAIAAERGLILSTHYIRWKKNAWVDALTQFRGTSVESHLDPQVFRAVTVRYRCPEVDFFAFRPTS